jgi:hypothetical protein
MDEPTPCVYKTFASDFCVTELLDPYDEPAPLPLHQWRYLDVTLQKFSRESNQCIVDVARALTTAARRLNVLTRSHNKREQARLDTVLLEGGQAGSTVPSVPAAPTLLVMLPVEIGRLQISGIKDAKAHTFQRMRIDAWGKHGSRWVAGAERNANSNQSGKELTAEEMVNVVVERAKAACVEAAAVSKKGKAPLAGIVCVDAWIQMTQELLAKATADSKKRVSHRGAVTMHLACPHAPHSRVTLTRHTRALTRHRSVRRFFCSFVNTEIAAYADAFAARMWAQRERIQNSASAVF